MELSFNTGDIIYVYGDMDDDGFYLGELRGLRALVPSNFLTEAPPDYDPSQPQSMGRHPGTASGGTGGSKRLSSADAVNQAKAAVERARDAAYYSRFAFLPCN